MNSSISFLNFFHSLTLLLVLIFLAKSSNGIENCGLFDCGESYKQISYPFRKSTQPKYCGHPGFVLDCEPETDNPLFEAKSQKFNILEIDPKARILKMARLDLSDKVCLEKSSPTDFDSTPFSYTPKDRMATLLYGCDYRIEYIPGLLNFSCSTKDKDSRSAYLVEKAIEVMLPLDICHISIDVSVMEDALIRGIGAERVLEEGFEVEWTNMGEEKCLDCMKNNGSCGYNSTARDIICYCPPNPHRHSKWRCVPLPSNSVRN